MFTGVEKQNTRAEAAEAEVERLKEVLGSIWRLSGDLFATEEARKALEAKP